MLLTRRISFGVVLALFVFVLGPNMAQAMCDEDTEGERSPRIENMGTISLNAGHTTLTISNAEWYPGALCQGDMGAPKDGSATAFVDQTPVQINGSVMYRTTAGPHYYTSTLDVSSLPNGTYSLAFLVDSIFGNPYFVQVNAPFTISRPPVNYMLTVAKNGTASGVGSVASSPAGISCGADCTQSYSSGTSVTLTATPGASTFAGWSGGGCSGTGNCVVTMNAAKTVTATFNTTGGTNWTLNVTKNGTGAGVVTSTGAINCGGTCSASIANGNSITLYANPNAGSTFAGWSGGGCSGTGSCAVTMNANKTVTATFNTSGATGCAQVSVASNVPTTWWIGGPMTDGQPLVQNTPSSGRSYTTDTAGNALPTGSYSGFNAPDPVAFGVPAGGWYGGVATPNNSQWCTGGSDISWTITFKRDGTCGTANGVATYTQPSTNLCSTGVATAVSGTAPQWTWSCTGEYGGTTASCAAPKKYRLTTTKSGAGTGTVTSNPAGISCGTGTGCYEDYNYNQSVVLTANPGTGETFLGWSGGGCSGVGTCTVVMTGDKTVDANFGHGTRLLTVTKNGSAISGGRVTSSPPGVDCGADCSQNYTYGLTIQLTPGIVAGSGAKFVSWGGACTGSGSCTPTMTMARTVSARYDQTYTLAVSKAGTGTGTVTAPVGTTIDGIDCGTNCSEGYWVNTIVTPVPTPAAGSVFSGWSGDADCADGSLTMSAARSCVATFSAAYTVTGTGGGVGGTISPGTQSVNHGSTAVLTVTPNAGYTASASGCGGSLVGTTYTTGVITANCTVTAVFTSGPSCSPATQNIGVGVDATLTATGGSGGYTWNAVGGTPNNGSGSPFTTKYTTEGTKSVTVRSGGAPESSPCLVEVEGNITVTSNNATTWTITSAGAPLSQGTPSTGPVVYSDVTGNRQYTIIPATIPGYTASVSGAGAAQTIPSTGGTITFNIIYTPDGTSGSVDLTVDGSGAQQDVIKGTEVLLDWTTVNAINCVASGGGWSGPRGTDGGAGETSDPILVDTTFILTCTNTLNGQLMNDSILVTQHTAACFDGIDFDGPGNPLDGFIDYPNDPGCPSCVSTGPECPTDCLGVQCDDNEYDAPIPDCQDGADNEIVPDGLIDEGDPGCHTDGDETNAQSYDANDNDERDTPIAQCNDTFDNDGDTFTDFPDDPGCDDALDVSELDDPDVEEF